MPLQGTASPIAGGGQASMYKSLSDRTRAAQAKRNDINMFVAQNQAIPFTASVSNNFLDLTPYFVNPIQVNIPPNIDYVMVFAGGFYSSTDTSSNSLFSYEVLITDAANHPVSTIFNIPCSAEPVLPAGLLGQMSVTLGLHSGWANVNLYGMVANPTGGTLTGIIENAWIMLWSPGTTAVIPYNSQFILGSATQGILGTNVLG